MARQVDISGTKKNLADCTAQDIRGLAQGAAPASPAADNVTDEALYATLAEEMQKEGATVVSDLGDDRVTAWETTLGLHYSDTGAILKGLGKSGLAESAPDEPENGS